VLGQISSFHGKDDEDFCLLGYGDKTLCGVVHVYGYLRGFTFTFTLPGPEAYTSDAPQPAGLLCNPERPQDARAPSSERWNFVGEKCLVVFADDADFHGT
jgi:hypothetical protein